MFLEAKYESAKEQSVCQPADKRSVCAPFDQKSFDPRVPTLIKYLLALLLTLYSKSPAVSYLYQYKLKVMTETIYRQSSAYTVL